MKTSELRIGQQVCYKMYNGKLSIPMTVVGIFTTLHDPENATVYLDFEGNESDVWEEEVKNLVESPVGYYDDKTDGINKA